MPQALFAKTLAFLEDVLSLLERNCIEDAKMMLRKDIQTRKLVVKRVSSRIYVPDVRMTNSLPTSTLEPPQEICEPEPKPKPSKTTPTRKWSSSMYGMNKSITRERSKGRSGDSWQPNVILSERRAKDIASPERTDHLDPIITPDKKIDESIGLPKAVMRNEKDQKKFDMIVEEVLQTERDYVKDLTTIVNVYILPLEKGNIVPNNVVSALFSNWKSLVGINKELLRKIEECCAPIVPPDSVEDKSKKLIVKITFPREKASKSVVAYNHENVEYIINKAIKKVAGGLPSSEQNDFLQSYDTREMYDDDGRIYSPLKNLLTQLEDNGITETPSLNIRRTAHPAPIFIGECFLHMATYLKLYSDYCNNQVAAATLLNKLIDENTAFYDFIDCCQFDNPLCRKLDLSSFLIMPMQRVCKYPLLLKRLLEHTPDDCDEFQSLKDATKVLSDAVQTINNKKRDNEAAEQVLRLQNNIVSSKEFDLFSPSRKFLNKDNCEVVGEFGLSPATYFLFNDLLLVTQLIESKFIVLEHFSLLDTSIRCTIEDRPQGVELVELAKSLIFLIDGKNKREEFIELIKSTILGERREQYASWVSTQKLHGFVSMYLLSHLEVNFLMKTVNKTREEWEKSFFPDICID